MKRHYKKNESVIITLPDNTTRESVFIGSGEFATCFKVESESRVYSFVKFNDYGENDYTKEGISEFADKTNPHIPDITREGDIELRGVLYSVFSMPLYNKLTKNNKNAYAQYELIMSVYNDFKFYEYRTKNRVYAYNHDIIDRLYIENLDDSILAALTSVADVGATYGIDYYIFDFHAKNFKVDSDGNLILLDPLCNYRATRNFKRSNVRR